MSCVLVAFLVLNEIFAFFKFSNGNFLVEIPKNSSAVRISNILKKNKVVGSSVLFSNYVKFKNVKLKYGVFSLNSAMSYGKIVEVLTDESKDEQHFVQLNVFEGSNFFSLQKKYANGEGFNFKSIAGKINSKEVYGRFGFSKLLKKQQLDKAFWPMEGFLATDSFNIKPGYDDLAIANLVLSEFDENISAFLEEFGDEFEKSRFDLWQLITLASIIQGETHKVSDMPLISSVLHNRLNLNFKKRLECDVTRTYSENMKKAMKSCNCNIDQKKIDSYNTYKCFGLPAGPVCNPGLDALKAALKPAKTKYFYFCVDVETKEAFFAKTFNEHCENLKKANLV